MALSGWEQHWLESLQRERERQQSGESDQDPADDRHERYDVILAERDRWRAEAERLKGGER